ncbi:hypothetical protein [Desertimonas flava]|jgi:hypothetical protein|uniref:hypothetical protein n=1 Tax=Desertimonas flava TaxID=2064846 RepID=UPI0013C41E01|nr:hypothetical protein [Desertimonas flava]
MTASAHEWSERSYTQLLTELNEERAGALGRVGRRLEEARARAENLGREIDLAEQPDPGTIDEHRRAYDDAEHWRWQLCVVRESNGLHDHRWVDAIYPPLRRR